MANTQGFWAKHARAYDTVMTHYSRHRALVETHVAALNGFPRVLESGCGPGHLTKRLLEESHRVYAIDTNQEALRLLRVRCGDNPNLSVENGDANDLPYKDNFFDGVSSMLVLWAMADPRKYLLENRRVLRPNGRLVLAGPGPETRDSVDYQLRMFKADLEQQGLFPAIQAQWDDFLKYTGENISHTGENWLTHAEIISLLSSTGFEVESIGPNPIYCNQGHIVVAKKRD